ncbi:MAG TPA: hypothetical protein VGH23_10870 [Rhizomicrobium sp.]|jgi:hypothetical protein
MSFVFGRNIAAVLLLAGLSSAALSSTALISAAWAVGVTDAPTTLDGTTILPDPSLNKGHVLPASVVTAGVAAMSARDDGARMQNCSRRNPCAVPTPARDQIAVPARKTVAGRHPDGSGAAAAKSHAPAGAGDLRS